jgi:hypothetical protein
MRLIIAGSRDMPCNDETYEFLDHAISGLGYKLEIIDEIVCGMAPGVDTLGEKWADSNKVDVRQFYAKWRTYGKAAGPIRNSEMAKYADAAIIIYNKRQTSGSKNMAECMRMAGKPCCELTYKKD